MLVGEDGPKRASAQSAEGGVMANACVLLAEGFEEIEAIAVIDVLRRAEVDVTTLSLGATEVKGAHGISVVADARLEDRADERWDAVILPGGIPGATNLRDDVRVQALLKKQDDAKRWVAAICAAPIALSKAGVLRDRRATSYPGFGEQLECADYLEARVVVDEHVITSRGPGTAIEFALALATRLRDEKTSWKVAEGMLVAGA
jgi:4-methyl-5(b-hydroxyethyl)-thiazole monophosphate biosynthesis